MEAVVTTPPAAPKAAIHGVASARAALRLVNIDALRGLVMLIMLVDHVRDIFYTQIPMPDPVDAAAISPALFFSRLAASLCAPVFVALTGISAWLYGQSHSRRQVSVFLVKRGLFLALLEITLVGFAWSLQFPPTTFWLQVIWAIGISMIALSALIYLPRSLQIATGLLIVGGHNLLDGIVFTSGSPWFVPWAMLHQRDVIELGGISIKTTYPVLPWIGVILLGYTAGPLFARGTDPEVLASRLVRLGVALVAGFVLLRLVNVYGDKPWRELESPLLTAMSFLALTKYPPSLLFLMPTLGIGALLLVLFQRLQNSAPVAWLATLGGAPMFFYLLHLYVLSILYAMAMHFLGPNKGGVFGLDNVAQIWILAALLLLPLYFPTRWFAALKQQRKDIAWLKFL